MTGFDVFAKLALRMKYPRSERLRKIFEKLITWDQADILLELPAPPDEIASKLNRDEETVNKQIEELYQKGLAVPTSKGYFLPRSIAQLHDTTITDPSLTAELADMWQEFSEEEWFPDRRNELLLAEQKVTHKIIPMVKALVATHDILPEEDVRSIIKEAQLIAIVPCPCRTRARLCEAPTDTCMQFRKAAEYVIKRGTGKEIFQNEAIDIINETEEHGLIHIILPFGVICSCCSCCCNILRPLTKYGRINQGLTASSYRTNVNEELCNGCQLCMNECHFEAIAMKNGKASVDIEKCFGCGRCVVSCPVEGALRLELVDRVGVTAT